MSFLIKFCNALTWLQYYAVMRIDLQTCQVGHQVTFWNHCLLLRVHRPWRARRGGPIASAHASPADGRASLWAYVKKHGSHKYTSHNQGQHDRENRWQQTIGSPRLIGLVLFVPHWLDFSNQIHDSAQCLVNNSYIQINAFYQFNFVVRFRN